MVTIPLHTALEGYPFVDVVMPDGGWENEYEFNAYMYPKLYSLLSDSNQKLVNSEYYPWMQVNSSSKNDMKPDFFVWTLPCLIEQMDRKEDRFYCEGCTYGKVSLNCAFMVDVIMDGKLSKTLPEADIGKLFAYLTAQSNNRNSNPRGMFYTPTMYIVAEFCDGQLKDVFRGFWKTPGCMHQIQTFLRMNDSNGTILALQHFYRQGTDNRVEFALGRGRFGCVFKVSKVDTCSLTPVTFALKVVDTTGGNQDVVVSEYEKLVEISTNHPLLAARSVRDSLVIGDGFVYYLIADVGERGARIGARDAARHLWKLHALGYTHGDPRIQNIIMLADKSLRWIDFRSDFSAQNAVAIDVQILLKTCFNRAVSEHGDVTATIILYQHEVSETNMMDIYDICKRVYNEGLR